MTTYAKEGAHVGRGWKGKQSEGEGRKNNKESKTPSPETKRRFDPIPPKKT